LATGHLCITAQHLQQQQQAVMPVTYFAYELCH